MGSAVHPSIDSMYVRSSRFSVTETQARGGGEGSKGGREGGQHQHKPVYLPAQSLDEALNSPWLWNADWKQTSSQTNKQKKKRCYRNSIVHPALLDLHRQWKKKRQRNALAAFPGLSLKEKGCSERRTAGLTVGHSVLLPRLGKGLRHHMLPEQSHITDPPK